ncbi:Myb/SANT-like domain [Sesbania bispinosa]|nr:Myb/SANT-like domain [Sesbania bispinosa]
MTKGKGQSSNPPQAVREMWRWTEEMDYVMLSQFTEEQNKGHRVGGWWLPVAYANVVNALRSAGVSDVTKQHIKNRMKTCNAKFAEAYDLFNSLSGFAWNQMTRMFEAEEEVWEDFIRDKPQAAKWKTLQIRHYDLLRGLFGSDRATGRKAATGRQAHSSLDKESIDLNDVGEDTSMNEQGDTHVDYHQNSTPNVESYSPANAPTPQSIGTSGSRGTKRKAPMIDLVETQMEKLTAGIGLVADALSKGNVISEKLHNVVERQVTMAERKVVAMEKRNELYHDQLTVLRHNRPHIYTEADVWGLLTEINVMEPYRMQCYEYLCSNEQKKRLLFGVPPHLRIQTLFQMMSEANIKKSKRGASKVSKDCTNESSKAKCKKSKHTPYQSELKGSLDYTRFFTNDKQMDTYLTGFQGRNLVEPRFMSVDFFRSKGFQFQELLEYQGLNHFVSIQCPYLQELVKVFYCNLTISNGDLCSEVKGVKIRVRPCDWLSLAGLKFEGEKFELTNICSWENYDRTEAVKGMIKQGCNHQTRSMQERILINWPLYIGQHMHKVKARKMTDLPYAMLITKMFDHYGVDTGKEGEVSICWSHRFDQAILNKMKIIQVEGVWQYANEIGFERDN